MQVGGVNQPNEVGRPRSHWTEDCHQALGGRSPTTSHENRNTFTIGQRDAIVELTWSKSLISSKCEIIGNISHLKRNTYAVLQTNLVIERMRSTGPLKLLLDLKMLILITFFRKLCFVVVTTGTRRYSLNSTCLA
jgi:hypothetical protein